MTSWTDRYVSADASGGNNGLTESTPWTLAEAVSNRASDQRVNIKAGSYTLGGSQIVLSDYWWRGYKDTVGDLDAPFVGAKTAQTDMPEIEVTSGHVRLAASRWNLSGIAWTNNSSSDPALEDDVAASFRINCKFISTASNLTRNVVQCNTSTDSGNTYISCEFVGNTTSYSTKPMMQSVAGRDYINCVFRSTSATNNWTGVFKGYGTATGCVFQNLKCGIEMSSRTSDISNNTFYNISDNAIQGNLSSGTICSTIIRNNYFHTIGGYCIANTNGPTADNKALYIANNTRYNSPDFIEFTDQYIVSDYTDSSDPFEDAAAGDFRLKSTSNGYQLLESGYWRADMARYSNAGAAQAECSGSGSGGSSVSLHPLSGNFSHPLAQ